jgi:hypothetical protein
MPPAKPAGSSGVAPTDATESPEGQLDHRNRQREYRCRLRQARPPVTDQGSISITSPASFRLWMGRCGEASFGAAVRAANPAQVVAALPDLRPHRTLHPSISTHSTMKVSHRMISPEIRAQIRRYFYAEHWKIGTIATELGVHPDAVRNAIESERFKSSKPLGASVVDPHMEFIRHTLDQHPRLRAMLIYQMIRDRGPGATFANSRWRRRRFLFVTLRSASSSPRVIRLVPRFSAPLPQQSAGPIPTASCG